MLVDGSDKEDVNLGGPLGTRIGGKTETLELVGPYQFALIFNKNRHVIETGKGGQSAKIAIGVDIISQRIGVMAARWQSD